MASPRCRTSPTPSPTTTFASTPSQSLEQLHEETEKYARYIKYLFLKSAQVVVQSRQGDVMSVRSDDAPGVISWFCIGVNDVYEINQEARRTIQGYIDNGQSILTHPLVIEISLKTAEGDSMVLENWVMSLKDFDEATGNYCTNLNIIYNNMEMLLKSYVCVCRILPAYKLSRRQGPDSFVFCYKIYSGQPSTSLLGERHETYDIGALATPKGTLNVRVDYRPESGMTLDPSTQNFWSSSGGVATSEHVSRSDPCDLPFQGKPFRSRSDSNKISDDSEPGVTTSDESSELRIFAVSPPENKAPIHYMKARKVNDDDLSADSSKVKFGAFTSKKMKDPKSSNMTQNKSDTFLDLFDMKENDEDRSKDISDAAPNERKPSLENSENKSSLGHENTSPTKKPEEFEFLDIRTPFALQSGDAGLETRNINTDLGIFFKETQAFSQSMNLPVSGRDGSQSEDKCELQDEVEDVTKQLSKFETNLAIYDDLIKNLDCESESDANPN